MSQSTLEPDVDVTQADVPIAACGFDEQYRAIDRWRQPARPAQLDSTVHRPPSDIDIDYLGRYEEREQGNSGGRDDIVGSACDGSGSCRTDHDTATANAELTLPRMPVELWGGGY